MSSENEVDHIAGRDESIWRRFLKRIPKSIKSLERKLSVAEAYDIDSGFVNEHDTHPFERILMYPEENVVGLVRTYYDNPHRQYMDYDIKKYFGLSITEWLDLPYSDAQWYMDLAAVKIKEDNKTNTSLWAKLMGSGHNKDD